MSVFHLINVQEKRENSADSGSTHEIFDERPSVDRVVHKRDVA